MGVGVFVPAPSSLPMWFKPRNLTIAGVLLCLTVIGIPFGIVVLLFALVFQVMWASGVCPVCENKILYSKPHASCNCYYCHERLVVKKGILTKINRSN